MTTSNATTTPRRGLIAQIQAALSGPISGGLSLVKAIIYGRERDREKIRLANEAMFGPGKKGGDLVDAIRRLRAEQPPAPPAPSAAPVSPAKKIKNPSRTSGKADARVAATIERDVVATALENLRNRGLTLKAPTFRKEYEREVARVRTADCDLDVADRAIRNLAQRNVTAESLNFSVEYQREVGRLRASEAAKR